MQVKDSTQADGIILIALHQCHTINPGSISSTPMTGMLFLVCTGDIRAQYSLVTVSWTRKQQSFCGALPLEVVVGTLLGGAVMVALGKWPDSVGEMS